MAQEFRNLNVLIEAAKEILKLESALKTYANADAEMAKMASERKRHENQIEALKKEEGKYRLEAEEAKRASDQEVENYKAGNEAKKRQLAGQLTPLQGSLSLLEQRIVNSRLELNQIVSEVRQIKEEKEQEAKYLGQLRQSIAALQRQHGIRA